MKKMNHLLFGAHMSISGEMYRAIERGESIGCTAIQIFTKNNRQWNAKPLEKEQIALFKSKWKESSIQSVIAHATYLINIASTNRELEQKSVAALKEEVERCNQLEIPYLVLHPGSHLKTDETEALKRIARNIDEVFESTKGKTSILLETMAGQGSSIGSSFEQLATIIALSNHKDRLGVCFDTCHAFAAGYDFRTEKSYNHLWKTFDKIIGLNKLHAIHINDSKTDLGSRVDRHADIGKGKVGLKAFELLFQDKRLQEIPKILETPYESLEDYKRNMDVIRSLIGEE